MDDAGLYRRVLAGIAGRDYRAAAEAVPAAFGLSKSSVSRRFIRASSRALQQLQARPLGDRKWLALVLDGKTFGTDQLVLALGVTRSGEKVLLGLVQTATENKAVCASFLRSLGERGFPLDAALLVVRGGAARHGAPVPSREGPRPSPLAAPRLAFHHLPPTRQRRVSAHPRDIT